MTARKRSDTPDPGSAKLSRLVKRLAEAEAALQAHVSGEVDAIVGASGHPLLLEKAQQRLIESEGVQRHAAELQRAILDALPANIALLDASGVILAVNESWRRFGAANAAAGDDFYVGRNYLAICEATDGECAGEARAAAAGIRSVLRGEIPEFSLEYPCHSPVEQRWYRLVATPLSPGASVGAVVMHLNVTERKLAELALLDSEGRQRRLAVQLESERARLVAAQAVAKVGSWETDLVNFAVTWSEETHHIFETDPATFAPTHEAFLARVHPEDRDAVDGAFARSLGENGGRSIVHRILIPEGRVKYVEERWQVFRDETGRPLRAIGTCRDITEHTLAERERRALADRLFSTLESVTDGFIMLDNEARFTYVNRQAETMLRRRRDDLIGQPMLESFPGLSGSEFERQYHRAYAERVAVEFEAWYAPLEAWFEARAYPLIDGLAVYFRDVTETRRAREALARTNRALQMLSRCNEALVRSETEGALLEEICRIATEIGGYRMAWVGYALDDTRKSLVPQASAGSDPEYLARLQLSWSEQIDVGRGPAGETIRTGRPVLVEDLSRYPYFAPWLEDAWRRGYRGLINLPLNDGHRTFGNLALYDGEVRTIPPDELKLLRDLADNLAFGIVSLRLRVERRKTHDAVLAMARGLSAETGTKFFGKMILGLVEAVGAGSGGIAQLDTATGGVRTLAAAVAGRLTANFAFDPAGTPCDHLGDPEVRVVERSAGERFAAIPGLPSAGLESYVGTTLFDSAGAPAGLLFVLSTQPLKEREFVVSTLRIFAARAAAEIEREKAAARTREQAALLDKAQDAILVRDLEHRITYWNKSAERLYGWTAAEALGKNVRTLLYFEPGPFDRAMEVLERQGEWVGELVQMRKDGQPLTIEGRWTLVRDEAGKPKSILAINTDITERKKLEAQFLRAQRMESIGTLAGGIAHDLNNLLAPVTMGVDLLKRFEPRPESQRILGNIERAARRGADLVKQVLSFARGVEGARVAVNLKHIMRDIEVIGHNTFPKNIRIESHVPADLWLVTGDPTQLHQVLLNLCVNARDAMPDGGTLALDVHNEEIDPQFASMNRSVTPGRYVVLDVTDTGSGMPREIVERIFEPFFTTKEVGKGTGLGLSTVLGIVRSHGGFVNVSSEPGEGSSFKVYLPAQPTDGPAAADGDAARAEAPCGQGETVLVVDDETSILDITKETLESSGYRVLTAEDGAQAIGVYATHRAEIALVLTDIMMPVMDGVALITALRRINPMVKVVAASGIKDSDSVARANGAGVSHFLAKPYSADVLLETLHQVLHRIGSRAPFQPPHP
jgi:PAS domain S-box-containing protein